MTSPRTRRPIVVRSLLAIATLQLAAACASSSATVDPAPAPGASTSAATGSMSRTPPSPDPRIGLRAGVFDAGEAIWNLRKLSTTPPARDFVGVTNSDLAFIGNLVIQGNYNGFMVWDVSNPSRPRLAKDYLCPASQSDVSVYKNLLFVSGEGLTGRLDCGTQGVQQAVSRDRLRGIRIFDISDLNNPRNVGNVQTCRGSHTHTVLVDPRDSANVYIYVSGSAGVRSADELPGCVNLASDPNSALFRIEVIRVPVNNPAAAAIVTSPRIFTGLVAPPRHGLSQADIAEIEEAERRGAFVLRIGDEPRRMSNQQVRRMLDSMVTARGGSGAPTAADSAALRAQLPAIAARIQADEERREAERANETRPGPNQCHDITVYPAVGYAGGACGGYGLLLDIRDPTNPVRIDAVADSNFSYWHSATFSNDGSKVLFTDEWGGGSAPKCRAGDPMEWGGNAYFTIENRKMVFQSYWKLPAPQTSLENCVAHNGSPIPIPGRDVMVQGWYQGGISIFDWTDPKNVHEIAFHDRGPLDPNVMRSAGSWSVYWYNGLIVSSEIARGLDIFELVPSAYLTQNEIDAANTVRLDYLNPQGQPQFTWPPSFALARAFVDQLERSRGLATPRLIQIRDALAAAERAGGNARRNALERVATELNTEAATSSDAPKVRMLSRALNDLAGATR